MSGLLESLLNKRYGQPKVLSTRRFVEYRWNDNMDFFLRCILYDNLSWNDELRNRFGDLEEFYGNARGGLLLGGCLKVSMIKGPKVFGLYHIEELQDHPKVKRANRRDSQICFFMDSANVWFYGLKQGQLYVYDSATDELDALGAVQPQVEELLQLWEEAKG